MEGPMNSSMGIRSWGGGGREAAADTFPAHFPWKPLWIHSTIEGGVRL